MPLPIALRRVALREAYPQLPHVRLYGRLTAAGPRHRGRPWTRREALELGLLYHAAMGQWPPTHQWQARHGLPDYSVIVRLFGKPQGYYAALRKEYAMPTPPRFNGRSVSALPPRHTWGQTHVKAYQQLRALGCLTRQRPCTIEQALLLGGLFLQDTGHVPTAPVLRDGAHLPALSTIRRLFGSVTTCQAQLREVPHAT